MNKHLEILTQLLSKIFIESRGFTDWKHASKELNDRRIHNNIYVYFLEDHYHPFWKGKMKK